MFNNKEFKYINPDIPGSKEQLQDVLSRENNPESNLQELKNLQKNMKAQKMIYLGLN